MKVLSSRDPNLFRVRTGGGCLMLFGLPFFLIGLAIVASPFIPGEADGTMGAIPVGLIFALTGAVLVFGRGGIDADRRRQEVARWWSIGFRVKSQVTPVAEIRQVALTKEIRRSKNSSTTVYPVYLETTSRVKMVEDQDYQASRRVAEGLAAFAGRPMADSSSGEEVVRQPAELNECVRDRARRLNEQPEIPSPPAVTALTLRQEPDGMAILLPKTGLTLSLMLPGLIYCGIALFFIFPLLATVMFDSTIETSGKLIGAGVLFTIFGLLPVSIIGINLVRNMTRQVKVVVDGRRLRVEGVNSWGKKAVEFPADELEELSVAGIDEVMERQSGRQIAGGALQMKLVMKIMQMNKSTGITARSDKASVTFGETLSQDDQVYLYQLIRSAIIC